MHPTIEDPFTLILTVPRALVGDDVDATTAIDPVLTAKFGWTHYDVVEPLGHDDLYEAAIEKFRAEAGAIDVVDPARALVHVVPKEAPADDAGTDVYMRVVRVFPVAFPIGTSVPQVGLA